MLWNAFVLGLGTTLGGSLGLMFFVVMFDWFKRIAHSKHVREAEAVARLSLDALHRRNELTEEQVALIQRLVGCCEVLAKSQESDE